MAQPGSDYDITLNSVGYMIDRDEKGMPRFFESRTEALRPPAGIAGGSTLLDSDPLDKYVIANIESLDQGFGKSVYERDLRHSYGASNGAWALDPFRVGPANKLYHISFTIRDPGAEEATTPWTASNGTATATLSVTNSYEGEYHWAFTTSADDGIVYQTVVNPTVLQSRSLTFRGMGRMSATATGEAVRLFIWDNVTGFTYSSAVSGTTYTAMTVTATINAAATTVRVGIADNGTLIDTATARVDALGVVSSGTNTPIGFVSASTNWYSAAGRFIYQWDETNDKFDIVYANLAADATDIEEFNGNVYVGTGNNDYVYGTTTSWTVSNRAGDLAHADFFARGMDRSGNAVMWRGLKNNTVSVSSNPANSGVAWTDYTVGESDSALTGVHWWNRTVLVGKRDGLYAFAINTFANITGEKRVAPSADNFAVGQEFQGSLYLSASQGSIWRFTLGALLGPLTPYIMEGYEHGPGGKTEAMGTDGVNLLVAKSQRSSTQRAWVLASRDGESVHTLYEFAAPDDTTWATTLVDTHFEEIQNITALGTFSGYTYAAGTTTAGVTRIEVARWATATTSEAPFRDTSPDPVARFLVRLPRLDGNFPADIKSFADVTLKSRDLSADTRTIEAYYRVDNGSWTSLGTFNTSPSQTLTFSNVNGREIELLLEAISTSGATSPIEYLPLTATATLRPARKRRFTAFMLVGEAMTASGLPQDTPSVQYTNLRTAEQSSNPITLSFIQDWTRGMTSSTSVSVHVRNVTLEKWLPADRLTRVYQIEMVEA